MFRNVPEYSMFRVLSTADICGLMLIFWPSIKPGTWNIPEHSGTSRNIPEHPGTREIW